MNKHYWLNWACFAFIGLLWATSPSHGAIYPILMLCNVPLMALTFREKNLGFKLWRWVGRKCGWYVEPLCNKFTKLLMDEMPALESAVIREMRKYDAWIASPITPGKFPDSSQPAHDPEMWTETKAVEKT